MTDRYQPDSRYDLANIFRHHSPKPGQGDRYTALREAGRVLAAHICRECPPSRERSIALNHVEESVYSANAAIARNE